MPTFISNMESNFICGCCREVFPFIHQHVHHIVPRSVGGKDTRENLIDLCPGCHDALHNIAYKLLSTKFSQAQVMDLLNVIYKENTKAISMCLKLAINVRDSLIRSREEGLSEDHVVTVSTSILKKHKDVLAVKCKDMGISQEEFLRQLVLKQIVSWSGAYKSDHLLESKKVKAFKKLQKSGT
jgi:hypothetical protein